MQTPLQELKKQQDRDLSVRLENWFIVHSLGAEPDPDNFHTSYEARNFAQDVFDFMRDTIADSPEDDDERIADDGDPDEFDDDYGDDDD